MSTKKVVVEKDISRKYLMFISFHDISKSRGGGDEELQERHDGPAQPQPRRAPEPGQQVHQLDDVGLLG